MTPAQTGDQTGDVLVRDEARVRWITLNRPESKNGLTPETNAAVMRALEEAGESTDVRAVAIAGAGGNFCSGLDLKAAAAGGLGTPEQNGERLRTYFHGVVRAVRACPKPVVAVVDGAAVGFGCDLALACDLRIASDRARFGEIFVRRGLMPDGGSTFHLARLIGLGRAMEMFLLGEIVEAAEALRLGMVNRVVPVAELEETARGYMARLAGGAPLVHRALKESVYGSLGDLEAALDRELKGQVRLLSSKDFMEGVMAFFQKRDPDFKGE